MKKKITLELDIEDIYLVQGVLSNYANFRAYSSSNHYKRDTAQRLADNLEVILTQDHLQQEAAISDQAVS